MENRIEVPIGRELIRLADYALDSRDMKSLELLDSILLKLVGTGIVISADEVSFIDIREYIEIAIKAIENNTSTDEVKRTSIRSRYDP